MNKDRVRALEVMLEDLNSMLTDRTFKGEFILYSYAPHTNLLRVEMFKNACRIFHREAQPTEAYYEFLLLLAAKEYGLKDDQDI